MTCVSTLLSVRLCVCSTVVKGRSLPDLGEKFLKDLKSVKDRSGPLPLWLRKRIVSDVVVAIVLTLCVCPLAR